MWFLNLTVNYYNAIDILWNLYLLAVPFFFYFLLDKNWEYLASKKILGKVAIFAIFILWLIFIPNSIYVITDLRHIIGYCPSTYYNVCIRNAWMILFFFTYSFIGWAAFIIALRRMKNLLADRLKVPTLVFIPVTIPIISLGVLLGLINRWNTWDLFIFPGKILADISVYFTNWAYFKNLLLYCFFLFLFYVIGNFLFKDKL